MEAYQQRDVKRDSFEEVDRILAIVEESKEKYDKKETINNPFLNVGFAMAILFGALTFFAYYKGYSEVDIVTIPPIVFLLAVVQIISVRRIIRKNRYEFEQTRNQATEVIREIVPALSHSERWSALRKFELRLRLSKLGISADKIFGHEFDLP